MRLTYPGLVTFLHHYKTITKTTYTLHLRTDIFTNTSFSNLTSTDDTTVDSTGDAVLLLDVELGESVFYELNQIAKFVRS